MMTIHRTFLDLRLYTFLPIYLDTSKMYPIPSSSLKTTKKIVFEINKNEEKCFSKCFMTSI